MLGLRMRQQGQSLRCQCPVHGGDERSLVVTEGKGYKCWASGEPGGDQIGLVAHVKQLGQRDAAELVETHFKFTPTSSPTVPPAPTKTGFDASKYLQSLDPEAEQLAALGISAEAFKTFRGGYCKSGVNRGRLALALCDVQGNILGFCGRALAETSLAFPTNVDPSSVIFGADHAKGETRLVKDVIEVLSAWDIGEPAICFLTDLIGPQQLETLASVLDQRQASLFF